MRKKAALVLALAMLACLLLPGCTQPTTSDAHEPSPTDIVREMLRCDSKQDLLDAFGRPDSYCQRFYRYNALGVSVRLAENGFESLVPKTFAGPVHAVVVHDPNIALFPYSDGLDDITCASSESRIRAALGRPDYVSNETHCIGYRMEAHPIAYDVFFSGEGEAREAAFYRRFWPLERDVDLLDSFPQPPEDAIEVEAARGYIAVDDDDMIAYLDAISADWPNYDTQYLSGDHETDRIFRFGIASHADGFSYVGRDDEYGKFQLSIYDNFPGLIGGKRLAELSSADRKRIVREYPQIEFRTGVDAVFEWEVDRLTRKAAFEDDIAHRGVRSPDGHTVISDSGEDSLNPGGVYIRYDDGREPVEIADWWYAGNYRDTYGFHWLDDRYVIFDHYKGDHAILDTMTRHMVYRSFDVGLYGVTMDGQDYLNVTIQSVDREKRIIWVIGGAAKDEQAPIAVTYGYDADGIPQLFGQGVRACAIDVGWNDHFRWLDARYALCTGDRSGMNVLDFVTGQRYAVPYAGWDRAFCAFASNWAADELGYDMLVEVDGRQVGVQYTKDGVGRVTLAVEGEQVFGMPKVIE